MQLEFGLGALGLFVVLALVCLAVEYVRSS